MLQTEKEKRLVMLYQIPLESEKRKRMLISVFSELIRFFLRAIENR